MSYGKCNQGHVLKKVDCPLINDYDYINTFCSAITNFFQNNKANHILDLSNH